MNIIFACSKAIVEELAGLGATVYTCARTRENVEARVNEWRESGLKVEAWVCDASVRASRVELMQQVSQHCGGKLDILVKYKIKPH